MRSITHKSPLKRAARKQQRPLLVMTRLAKVIACGVVRPRLLAVLLPLLLVPISRGSRYVEARLSFEHLLDKEQR